MSEGPGRADVERKIIQRSIEDEAFRQQLLADPKGAVEQELGTRLPEGVRVVAVEERADTAGGEEAGAPATGTSTRQILESSILRT